MVDLNRSRSLANAVFAIYYHTESAARKLAHPDSLPEELAIPSMDDAVDQLHAGLQQNEAHGQHAARLGISQLYRAQFPRARSTQAHGDHIGSLSGAFRQHIERSTKSVDHERELPRFKSDLDDLHQNLRAPSSSPDQCYFHAFNRLRPPAVRTHELRRYSLSWSYRNQVTDVASSVEVKRPLQPFRAMLDPRNWHAQVPIVWDKSFGVKQPPQNRASDGTAVTSTGPTYRGVFYEQAVFSMGTPRIATYRNLLDVDIDVGNDTQVGYRYRQNECLSAEFLSLGRVFGGIDADRGHALCTALDPSWCRLEGRKRARFDQPAEPLKQVYNDLASVYLLLLIQALVLFGAEM